MTEVQPDSASMVPEQRTPRACNKCSEATEDRWSFPGVLSRSPVSKLDSGEEANAVDKWDERSDRNGAEKEHFNDNRMPSDIKYPQCRFPTPRPDAEDGSAGTETSVADSASENQFRVLPRCRFVQVRHNNERHLFALPFEKTSPSVDCLRYRDELASAFGAAFKIPPEYRVVGLIGPFFEYDSEEKQGTVVLPLAILGHPEATFIDRYYNEFVQEGEEIARHEFELLLYPHPTQENGKGQNSTKDTTSTSDTSNKNCEIFDQVSSQDQASVDYNESSDKQEDRDVYRRLGLFLVTFIRQQVQCHVLSHVQGETLLRHLLLQQSDTSLHLSSMWLSYDAYNVDVVFQGAYHVAKWIQNPKYLAQALSLIADNLSRESSTARASSTTISNDEHGERCRSDTSFDDVSHLDQGEMIKIAQVLLECGDIELPNYMALVDAILTKNKDIVYAYHKNLLRMEEEWLVAEYRARKTSLSSLDDVDNFQSFGAKSLDIIMGDIRYIALCLNPILAVLDTDDSDDVERLVDNWSNEDDEESIDPSSQLMSITDELVHAAATLVDQDRISLEAATKLVSSYAREDNPLVKSIHDYCLRHNDFEEFLQMLEYLIHAEGMESCNDNEENYHPEVEKGEVKNAMDPSTPIIAYDVFLEEVAKWEDFGQLELAALRMCIAKKHPELREILHTFYEATQKRSNEFHKTIRSLVDRSIEEVRDQINWNEGVVDHKEKMPPKQDVGASCTIFY